MELLISGGGLRELCTKHDFLTAHNIPHSMSGGIYPCLRGEENIKEGLKVLARVPFWRKDFIYEFQKYKVFPDEVIEGFRKSKLW